MVRFDLWTTTFVTGCFALGQISEAWAENTPMLMAIKTHDMRKQKGSITAAFFMIVQPP
jgi:hypothetical protein